MYVTHLWTFIGKLKGDRGVGAGVSKILTCLPNRSGPHRSILEISFLRQKCVKLKNFHRWVHLKSRNWDTAFLWNFRYTYRKSRSKIKNFGKKIFLIIFELYWIELEFWILTLKNEKKFLNFWPKEGGSAFENFQKKFFWPILDFIELSSNFEY